MSYLLGIDIGTSGTKTVLFNSMGETIASSLGEYQLYQPEIGWAEQEPEDWWNATVNTVRDVLYKSGINPKDIKGIGLSGQMHGLVLLDKDNKVLRRSIIWCDQRTEKECIQITNLIGKERIIEITANPALTGFTASKIMWVKNHEPEIFERVAKILLPKDYIRYKLTGEFATEVSDASGMQLLNIFERNWSSEIIDKLGIDRSLLANVYESQEISGSVHSKASSLTGLREGTPVVGGGGDQAAGAIGNGVVKKGIISSTIGTSGVVFAYTDKVTVDPKGRVHTFCHAIPGAWHVMGVTQGAGLSLKWFRDNFCMAEKITAQLMETDPYNFMSSEAEKSKPGCDGLLYLPYLMGERTPHLDAYAKAVFYGLSARHKKTDMLRSIMEGVGYSLNDCMNIITGMGIEAKEVRASGGGGKSPLWRQIQSDMFERDVVTINSTEGPALGAAILAAAGTGVYSNIEEACSAIIKTVTVQHPIKQNSELYKKYYIIYKNLYTALKDQFKLTYDIISNS